jgi:hypothetical protein
MDNNVSRAIIVIKKEITNYALKVYLFRILYYILNIHIYKIIYIFRKKIKNSLKAFILFKYENLHCFFIYFVDINKNYKY